MNLASRNVLKVFLASPGDLIDERRIARDVVMRLNRSLGKEIGLHVELLGWEDTLPGAGRPQDIINQDVEICDLFIGLLWKHWGQPTGKFSSGFKEELTIAEKRYSDAKAPDIWLFFKNIDKDFLEDPGKQLKLVLNFRQKQIAEKKYLFKTFDNPKDWKDSFQEMLTIYLMRIFKTGRIFPEPSPNESPVPSYETRGLSRSASREAIPEMVPATLLEALEKSIEVVRDGSFGKKGKEISELTEFEISRIFLAASALLSDRYTYEPLGVHGINICYKYRDKYDLVSIEKSLILRTMISSSRENVPGWYWFKDFKKAELCFLLRYIALFDNDAIVRQSAIQFFTTTRLLPHKTQARTRTFYTKILNDTSREVKTVALQLIGKFGQIQDIELIEHFPKERELDLHDEALKCKIEIILRQQSNAAFSTLLASGFDKEDVKYSYLENSIVNADDSTLFDHIENEDVRVRDAIVGELLKRKKITKDLAIKLLEDSSLNVKHKACLAIIDHGESITPDRIRQIFYQNSESTITLALAGVDVDEILLELFLTWPLSKLLDEVDWYSLNGSIAYRAIAIKYYNEGSVDIESDLEGLFAQIREKAFSGRMQKIEDSSGKIIAELESKLTPEKVKSLKDKVKKQVAHETSKTAAKLKELDDFILRNFTSAALASIAQNGEAESIKFGRNYINHGDTSIKLQALKIVERFGDETDVKFLIDIAKNSYGEIKSTATHAALKFSSDYQQAVTPLLQTKDTELVKQVVKYIWNDDVRRVRPVLEDLLNDTKDKNRKVALSYFVNKFGRKKLEEMLSEYLERTTYYYNIVHLLDKTIYSTRAVRSHFLQELMDY